MLFGTKPDDTQLRRAGGRLEEAIRKKPDSIALLFDLANLQTFQGHYQDAERCYRRISELDKNNAGPLNNLAWLLAVADGEGTKALSVIGQAIDLAGPTPALLDTRALAYLAMGRSDLALMDLKQAIAARPTAECYLHLAQAHLMAKDRKAAAEALQKVRSAGLNVEGLLPPERKAYDRLLGELARK